MTITNREQWLTRAVDILQVKVFGPADITLPSVRVSVGWPSRGGTSNKGRVIGQCWKACVAEDGIAQLFISPTMGADPLQTLGVLVHELIHAVDDCNSGHKGAFATMAKKVGLGGKMTATVVIEDSDLAATLRHILAELGRFPHAPLDVSEMEKQRTKQTTRMIKLTSDSCCGYTVRTTMKWIEQGMPKCPCGTEMELA